MTEERYRLHDTLAKWLSLVLAIGGFGVALTTYIAQQEQTRDQNDRLEKDRLAQAKNEAAARAEEYKRRLWERQLELYLQACKTAGTISTVENPKHPEYGPARIRFEQLYNGELCIVESPTVASLMIKFRDAMQVYEKNPSTDSREQLRRISIELAHACRDSTAEKWEVSLEKLQEKN